MTTSVDRVESLRQQALAKMRANEMESAVELLDAALAIATDDEAIELLVLNKAGVMISMEKSSPEVQQLPQILMRQRNARHRYLAAYYLRRKFEAEKDYKRATFYAKIALETAESSGDTEWKAEALFALAKLAVFESRIPEAVDLYTRVLDLTPDDEAHLLRRSFTFQNLGYTQMQAGDPAHGIQLILQALEMMERAGIEGYAAESWIDLCFGYLETGELDEARHYGEIGLEHATEVRQVRNAHFLLGEVAYKQGDTAAAELHFDHLATFYPDFPHLKNLLFALDLRGMVNFKL
ncbi:MAG: hypothetical protein WBX15_17860 [Thermoanaerobaculia bacterium]